MRGLKHTKDADNRIRYQVASFTDAWIETMELRHVCSAVSKSHLLQMRGLKLWFLLVLFRVFLVASFTDAWIETSVDSTTIFQPQSHLLQMRGLKHGVDWTGNRPGSRIFYRCVD